MKKFILVLFIGIVSSLGAFAQGEAVAKVVEGPVFEFETETIDYGKIEKNANGERVFIFTNIGTEPLIVANVKGTCGCTVPTKPDGPIMPGEKGEIKVKYATSRIGGFSKTITITSNATEPRKVIKIKGIVLKPTTTSEVEKKKSIVAK